MVVVIDYWSTLVCIHTTFAKLAETRPRGQKRPTVYLLFNFFSGLQKKLHVGVLFKCIIWNIMQVSENPKKKKGNFILRLRLPDVYYNYLDST